MWALTSKEKLIGGSIVVLLLMGGGFYFGSKWTRGRVSREIASHVATADVAHGQGEQAAAIAAKQDPLIMELGKAVIEQQAILDKIQVNQSIKDRKFQELLNSNAADRDKLAGALEVIKDRDNYIDRLKETLVNKDKIIDATTKKADEYKMAYEHELKSSEELRKALSAATSVKFHKYNFSGSYAPTNGDWGVSADRNFENFPVSVGLACDRTTLTQDLKELRFKLRLGFNL